MSSPTNQIKLRGAELKLRCIQLRKERYTYEKIAEATGCSMQRAHAICKEYLTKLHEASIHEMDLWRQDQLSALEEVIASHWENRGQPEHAGVILRALDARAKLLGINAPEKIDMSVDQLPLIEYVTEDRIIDAETVARDNNSDKVEVSLENKSETQGEIA